MTFRERSTARLSKAIPVEMKGKPDVKHRDMIQFWNRTATTRLEDIVIRGNMLEAPESATHGIYMGNDVAHKRTAASIPTTGTS